jgi:hypothetical protein
MAGTKMRTIIILTMLLITTAGYSQKSGFYTRQKDPAGIYLKDTCTCPKQDTNHYTIIHANGVEGGTWNLRKKDYLTYTYPKKGWYWAESKKQALQLLLLKLEFKKDSILDK